MAKISKYSLDDSVSGGDKVIGTDGATGLTKNFTVNELAAYLHDIYNVTGVISVNTKTGVVTLNTDDIPEGLTNLYDKEVTLTGVGATQVTGAYPNFTISSEDTNTTYDAGDGIQILNNEISNTKPDQEVTITGYGSAIISGEYPNFNIEVIDKDTVYTAGSGISIDGNNVITNTNQDKVVSITGGGATTVTGSYPNFQVSSTDTNTLYSAGENIEISGNTINAIVPEQTPYRAGFGIEINEGLTITNSLPGRQYTAGDNIVISSNDVISAIVPDCGFKSYMYNGTDSPTLANNDGINGAKSIVFIDGLYQHDSTYTYDGFYWTFSESIPSSSIINILESCVEAETAPDGIIYANGVCGDTYSGGTIGYFEYTIELGPEVGNVLFSYESFSIPDKFEVEYNNQTVINTGYVGDSEYDADLIALGLPATTAGPTGAATFVKSAETPSIATVRVSAPLQGTAWEFRLDCPA